MSMSAKELHGIAAALLMQSQADEDGVMVTVSREACDKAARALAAYASLLAAVESSGDELVREFPGFTPGPWEWNGDNQLWGGERGNSGPMEEVLMAADDGKDYGMHCAIVRHHWDAKVAEANRRLIAAAPALLARITQDAQEKAALKAELEIVKAEREGLRKIIRMAAAYGDDHFYPYIQSRSGSMIHVAEVLDHKEGA